MVVVFANAINLIDGLDGLAAGIVIIAGTALFLYSDRLFKDGFLEGSNIAPLVAVIAVGICIGFLPYNFNPARIFMGDAGALFLGLLLAVTTITVGGRADYQYSANDVLLLRAAVHPDRDPRCADRRHRVLGRPAESRAGDRSRSPTRITCITGSCASGHGPRRTVVILWLWTALLSGLALVPAYTNEGNALVPLGVMALALLLYALFFPGRHDVPADFELDPPGAEAPGRDRPRRSRPPRTWWISRAGAGAPDDRVRPSSRPFWAFGLTLVEPPGSLRIHSQAGPGRAARHRDSAKPVGVDRGWNSEASGRSPEVGSTTGSARR